MHFLCLHSLGTNSEILARQTAPLRHHHLLASSGWWWTGHHSYDFIEGSYRHPPFDPSLPPCPPPLADTCRAYFLPAQPDTVVDAVRNLRALLDEGMYDGVLAVGQGATLLATLLLSPLSPLRDSARPPCRLKVAIFLSAAPPPGMMGLDYQALQRGRCEVFDGKARAERIEGLVTAHVYGKNDRLAAAAAGDGQLAAEADWLWDLCKGPRGRSVHGLGHAVPDRGRALDDAVWCVRRAIEEAEGGFGFDQVGLGRG